MSAFLDVSRVSYTYHEPTGETLALSDISFEVEEGSFLSIVGPSGCGKSTLLSLLCGLLSPDTGSITRKNDNIGYMLQHDQLFDWRTTEKNVSLGLEIQHRTSPAQTERINRMLDLYGLSGFASCKPGSLSGGMRQRAALIRTLILEPELLLLDEPFSALDYQTRLTVADDIAGILRREKKTAILVTHDIAEAISFADRVLVLSSRPSTVKAVFDIKLTADRHTPLASRSAKEFTDYFNAIWKEMIV